MVPKGKRSRKRELVELGEKNQGNVQKELIIYNLKLLILASYHTNRMYQEVVMNDERTPQYHSQAKIDHRIVNRSV